MHLLFPLCALLLLGSYNTSAQPSTPYSYAEVDVRPEPIGGFEAFSDAIEYPELARRAGIEGTVLVYFTVDRDGTVVQEPLEYDENGRVTNSGEHPICYEDPGGQTCEVSLQAFRAALLTPGYVDSSPVAVSECYAIEFWLPEGKGDWSVPTRVHASPCP